MHHTRIAIAAVLVSSNISFTQTAPSTKVIDQPDAPVSITNYGAGYTSGGTYSSRGINHSVGYVNKTDRDIIAVRFGLVSFDIWNEFLSKLGGFTNDRLGPNKPDRSEWVDAAYRGFTFFTGVAYVDKVRFADGEIWTANLDMITAELRKIEKTFSVDQLKKKDPDPRTTN